MNAHVASFSTPNSAPLPRVSIIIATRNEQEFIGACVDSILASDYPQDKIEIIVVDGMSTDRTRAVVEGYRRWHKSLLILDNPRKIAPVAFNLGIENSSGDLVMIMNAHATYEPDAIRKCVKYSQKYNAENVGGICITRPRNSGVIANAIVAALSHPFGVGGAAFRTGGFTEPIWADTAAFGCYRREVFDTIGTYNEQLVHSQDIELNLRLKSAGGRTLLAPDIVLHYSARSTLPLFYKHNFRNGLWVILPFAYSNVMPVGLRHLVPMFFVLFLLCGSIATVLFPLFGWIFFSIIALYLVAATIVGVQIASRERDWRLAFAMPLVFAFLHIPYGAGSLVGLVKVAMSPNRRKLLDLPIQQRARAADQGGGE